MNTTIIFSSTPRKRCYKCGEELPVTDFHKDSSKKDGLHGRCKACHQAAKRAKIVEDPDKRHRVLKRTREYAADRNRKKTAYVRQYKESTPCTDCGRFGPYYCMDFDHTGPQKNFEISMALANTSVSLEMIQAEIALCELVCAYCHRIRTHNQGYRRNS